MQGLSPPPSPTPNPDLPNPNRTKRGRSLAPDLDVELDCYFRSKRFMTEAVTKEMEDVIISEPPLTTSPSRTSTLTRLAEKGPSRSNIAGVLDFDAPKLSIVSAGRRRHLVVTNAHDVCSPRSQGEGSLSGSGSIKFSDYELEEDEEDEENYFSPLEWRLPPSSPRPSIPRPIPVENALQRLIEKKKEAEAKQVVVHRSPSDIIKGAAQNALYARLRSQSTPIGARHVFGGMSSATGAYQAPYPSNSRYPGKSIPLPIHYTSPTRRSSVIVEELPDDETELPQTPPLPRPSYADFMAIDEEPSQPVFSPPHSSSSSPPLQSESNTSLRTSGSFARAAAQYSGYGGGFSGGLNRSSSSLSRTPPGSPPPRFSMFSDADMDTDGMDLSTTPPPSAPLFMSSSNGGFFGR